MTKNENTVIILNKAKPLLERQAGFNISIFKGRKLKMVFVNSYEELMDVIKKNLKES